MQRTLFTLLLIAGTLCAGASQAKAELLVGLTTQNALITFDSAAPGTTTSPIAITGLQSGETILGIDFRPATGALFGLGSTSRLYVINVLTGFASQVGTAGAFTLSGTAYGFDFNPTVDRIRVTSNTGQNLRLNPNDGTLTGTDTALAYASLDPNSAATPRVVGSAYTNNFNGAGTTTLYAIDSNLDSLATQNPPNNGTLNTVGTGLGFNTADLVGFDISGQTGVAYAAFTTPTGSLSQLFTINLGTGAATLVGTVGGGVIVSGLAAPAGSPVPEPTAMLLLSTGLAGLGMELRKRRKGKEDSRR